MKAAAATVLLLAAAMTGAMASAAAQTQTGASSPRARSARAVQQPRALPFVLPEQFAPPQEAYASFPEPDGDASAAPPAPSACQLRLTKVAVFQALGTLQLGSGATSISTVFSLPIEATGVPSRWIS